MVRWHHQLSGCEFKQTPADIKGQRTLVCCSLQGAECWTQQLSDKRRLLRIAMNVAPQDSTYSFPIDLEAGSPKSTSMG